MDLLLVPLEVFLVCNTGLTPLHIASISNEFMLCLPVVQKILTMRVRRKTVLTAKLVLRPSVGLEMPPLSE